MQASQASSGGDLGYADGVSYCSKIWQGNACMQRPLIGLLRLVVLYVAPALSSDVLAHLDRILEQAYCTAY